MAPARRVDSYRQPCFADLRAPWAWRSRDLVLPLRVSPHSPTELTYYRCKKVFDALERRAIASGSAGKNMFGQYNDRHLKEWAAIVSQFPSSCIHLADAAKVLVQLTTYEMYGVQQAQLRWLCASLLSSVRVWVAVAEGDGLCVSGWSWLVSC